MTVQPPKPSYNTSSRRSLHQLSRQVPFQTSSSRPSSLLLHPNRIINSNDPQMTTSVLPERRRSNTTTTGRIRMRPNNRINRVQLADVLQLALDILEQDDDDNNSEEQSSSDSATTGSSNSSTQDD